MKYFKYIMLCCSVSLVFANNSYPTQGQIDRILKEAMQVVWTEAMNAKTAINGKWINSPGRSILNMLKKDLKAENLPIIAEDLGVITADVE